MRLCDRHEDLVKFMDIMISIDTEVLYKRNCYKPNCITPSWSVESIEDALLDAFKRPDGVQVQLILQKSVPVPVHRYSLAYGFINFVADFGGYLGLLLGASLLSVYDGGINLLQRAFSAK